MVVMISNYYFVVIHDDLNLLLLFLHDSVLTGFDSDFSSALANS